MDQAGVVYKIDCNDCEAVYVGETGRQLKVRVNEHKEDVRKQKMLSNVYMHSRDNNHSFDFNNVNVLDRHSNANSRKQLESIYTFKSELTINRAYDLNDIYSPLFASTLNTQ